MCFPPGQTQMENLKFHSLSVRHNSMSAWVLTSQNAHPSSTKPAMLHLK